MEPMDRDQLERIRAKAYAIVQGDPGGPNAEQARRILSKLPKIKVGQGFDQPGLPKDVVQGELSGGDLGAELPQTPDEALADTQKSRRVRRGLESKPSELTLPQKAALVVGSAPYRREFERGVDDMVTFGAGQKIAGAAGRALGDKPDVDLGATEKTDYRTAPNSRAAGQLTGSVLPGATRYLANGLGTLSGGLVKPLTSSGPAGTAFAGLLGGAAANTLLMPAITGAQTAIRGPEDDEKLKDFASRVGSTVGDEFKNPLNPIIGGTFGLVTGGAAGIANSRGQTGRDIRLVEEYGAKPNPIGGARGGIFKSPLLKDVEGSTREAGAMSRRAARGVLGGLQEEQKGLSRDYGAAKKAAGDAGFLEARIDPLYVREEADRLMKGERITNGQRAAIQAEVTDALDRHPGGMSLDDFNDFRAKLGDIFGTGPKDAAHPALDALRQAAKRTVDETEMGPINEAYSKGTEALNKKYEQLKLTRQTNPRVAEERIAGEILRRGENTPTSGIQEPAVEEFLASNPKYRALFDTISLLNAKDRMSLGLEGHGGSLYSRLHGIVGHNVEPLMVGAYRLGMPFEKAAPGVSIAAHYLNGGDQ